MAKAEDPISKKAKELKDVAEAIERVTKLESDLQQQLSKAEDLTVRKNIANELSNAAEARLKLVGRRGNILKELSDPTS